MVIVDFIIPSKEKKSKELSGNKDELFMSEINSEKHMFLLNNSSPIPRIDNEIKEKKSKTLLIMKYE